MKNREIDKMPRKKIFFKIVLGGTLLLSSVVISCATKSQKMLDASAKVEEAEQNVEINKYAPVELREAKMTVKKAESASDEREVDHYSDLASIQVDIAEQTAKQKMNESELASLKDSRKDILLDARNREIKAVGKESRQAKERAEIAENRAGIAEDEALDAKSAVKGLSETNKALEEDLKKLKGAIVNFEARETERGLELTLKDVLFESNQATLKAGNERTIERLVDFLSKSPSREVLIEGHTDSVGDEIYNKRLSQERAQTVQNIFWQNGISLSRLKAEGYGESFPVASNSSKAGRQQNRRVEIIVLNENQKAKDNVRK